MVGPPEEITKWKMLGGDVTVHPEADTKTCSKIKRAMKKLGGQAAKIKDAMNKEAKEGEVVISGFLMTGVLLEGVNKRGDGVLEKRMSYNSNRDLYFKADRSRRLSSTSAVSAVLGPPPY